jgi:tetraacyldisaccharide 4'-kinase
LSILSAIYGRAAGLRRGWYERHPASIHRLERPVISVGNLVVGGSGKTPVVAALADLLRRAGERPAVLSRGYARRERGAGVLIVSDGTRVLEPTERSGDEPQMLARMLAGVPIFVSPDRYQAGRLAETRFGCTVSLLDDGFQHLKLARDVDLLLVSPADLGEAVLPSGALREPLTSARQADALLVPGTGHEAKALSAALHVTPAFSVVARHEAPRLVSPFGAACSPSASRRVVAVAGIARPERFFKSLRQQGWDVASEVVFRDHHWFNERDLARVAEMARARGVELVMTTEKDAVRVGERSTAVPWAYLPLRVSLEPADAFAGWLEAQLSAARQQRRQGT